MITISNELQQSAPTQRHINFTPNNHHNLPWLSALVRLACATALILALVAWACVVAAPSPQLRAASSSTFFSNHDMSSSERFKHPYFPESDIVLDMAILSHAVYKLKNRVTSCNTRGKNLVDNFLQEESRSSDRSHLNNYQTEGPEDLYKLLLPEGTECLHYSHDYSLGTQVLVVRSSLHKYVAVAYAGTDDWRTALMDGNVLMSDLGPTNFTKSSGSGSLFDDLPDGIQVHRGFNEAVFDSEHFDSLLNCVKSARLGGNCGNDVTLSSGGVSPDLNTSSLAPYQLFTTGHSLGAADSVLLGAALHMIYPNEDLRSINFGCPKIGNIKWAFWINSLQPDKKAEKSGPGGSYSVFRFVNKIDLVPRLPELGVSLDPMLAHTGHTLQMSAGGLIRAYYDHVGDEDIGYSGVPFGWEAVAYAFFPMAVDSHPCSHYVEYLSDYKPNSTSDNPGPIYYVNEFECVEGFVSPPEFARSDSTTISFLQL